MVCWRRTMVCCRTKDTKDVCSSTCVTEACCLYSDDNASATDVNSAVLAVSINDLVRVKGGASATGKAVGATRLSVPVLTAGSEAEFNTDPRTLSIRGPVGRGKITLGAALGFVTGAISEDTAALVAGGGTAARLLLTPTRGAMVTFCVALRGATDGAADVGDVLTTGTGREAVIGTPRRGFGAARGFEFDFTAIGGDEATLVCSEATTDDCGT